MYAIRYHKIGDPDVLRWEQVDVPALGIDEVLVKKHGERCRPEGNRRT